MPELPEVETIRRCLALQLEGKIIRRVEVRLRELRTPIPAGFEKRVEGRRIERLVRRAKYLLFELSGGGAILMHLGMSGHLLMASDSKGHRAQKHDHVVIHVEGDGELIFNDPRRFGVFDFLEKGADDPDPRIAGLGPEPFGNEFSAPSLLLGLGKRSGAIKPALLDQRLIAGIGNIYACEALFRAGISPRRKCPNISPRQAERLVTAIREVLSDAIAAGGSSISDFSGADGKPGYFQHRFKVYDRAGTACLASNCGGVIKQLTQAGRSTYYCGHCQR